MPAIMTLSDDARHRQFLAGLCIAGLLTATPEFATAADALRGAAKFIQPPQVTQSPKEGIGRLLISVPSEVSIRSAYRRAPDFSHSPEILIERFVAMAGELSALSEFAEIGVRTEYDLPGQEHKSYQQLGYTAMIWPELRLKESQVIWLFIHEDHLDQRQVFVDNLGDSPDLAGWRAAVRRMQRTIAAEL